QKTITIEYNRAEAVQRTYAPQAFIGLLLDELADKRSHLVQVDLDDAFFRVFGVTVDAPIDFEKIGLTSAQIALDYGYPADTAPPQPPRPRRHPNHQPRRFQLRLAAHQRAEAPGVHERPPRHRLSLRDPVSLRSGLGLGWAAILVRHSTTAHAGSHAAAEPVRA